MSSPTDWDSWRKVLVYCRLDLTDEDHREDREDRNSHFGPVVTLRHEGLGPLGRRPRMGPQNTWRYARLAKG